MNRGDPQSDATNPGDHAPGELLRVAQKASGSTTATKDDSGMIDLRALMASAKPPPPRARLPLGDTAPTPLAPAGGAELTPLPVVRHLSVYPFGAPPEPEEPGSPAQTALPASSLSPRTKGVLLGLGAALIAGGAAILFLLPRVHGGSTETPPAQALATSPARVDSALLQATPEALPAPAIPAPTATAAAEDVLPAETARPAPPKAAPPPRATIKKPIPQASKSSASAPAKSPLPADTCKGNLLCAMKRATAEH